MLAGVSPSRNEQTRNHVRDFSIDSSCGTLCHDSLNKASDQVYRTTSHFPKGGVVFLLSEKRASRLLQDNASA